MPSHNEIDERFSDLVRELRSGNADAPDALRERVRAIAAQAPPPRPVRQPLGERFRLRRAVLILVPACVVAAASAAMLHGLTSSGSAPVVADKAVVGYGGPVTMQALKARARDAATPPAPASGVFGAKTPGVAGSSSESAAAPPPSARYQDYRVTMRVRVTGLDSLSKSVVKAMRVTRALGGYVANVSYSSPNVRHGDAVLLLRVPIANVQKAVLTYAGLGALVAQHFTVVDLQKRYDAEVEQLGKLRFQIARFRSQIENGELSDVEKAHTQEQLEYARLRLLRLQAEKRTTLNHARLSTVRLSLTTFHKKQKEIIPAVPSRFDRMIDDAGGVLGTEAIWFAYALLVAGPFALLALLLLAAERSRRRRSERRLLAATG
jgi:hypothetical protein